MAESHGEGANDGAPGLPSASAPWVFTSQSATDVPDPLAANIAKSTATPDVEAPRVASVRSSENTGESTVW